MDGLEAAPGLEAEDPARRAARLPRTAPRSASGAVTSTSITGSRSRIPAFRHASRNAIAAQVRNACSEESTSWAEPSSKATRTSTTG